MMRVSVIIPTLNEAGILKHTLYAVSALKPHEVIVADGASDDDTARIARGTPGVRLIDSPRGRAAQMNAGAAASSGDILLFLHADTRLPARGIELVSKTLLTHPHLGGGRFRGSFDINAFKYRVIAYYTRFAFFSYGDQAFFVRRSVFEAMGGYRTDAAFEDVDFFNRLKKRSRVVILNESVATSARRFEQVGFFKQKAANLCLSSLCRAGLLPVSLARKWYPEVR